MPLLRLVSVALLFLVLLRPAGAEPQRCAVPAGMSPALGDIDVRDRLAFVNRELGRTSTHAVIWTGVFAGTFGALAAGSAILAGTLDEPERVDYIVSGVTAFVGVLKFALTPLPVTYRLKGYFGRVNHTFSERRLCDRLAEGERLLELEAKAERFGKSWLVHAGNFLLNMGGALAIGLSTGRWGNAGLQQLVGFALGELMIVTQPSTADRALQAYRSGSLVSPERRILSLAPAPFLLRDGAGLSLAASF